MSSAFTKALKISIPSTFGRNLLNSISGASYFFRVPNRYYNVTSIDSLDMTEKRFTDPDSEDCLGSHMREEDRNVLYHKVLAACGVTEDQDQASARLLFNYVKPEDIKPIDDLHGAFNPEMAKNKENITSIVRDFSKGTPEKHTLTYGPETAVPYALLGGPISNTIWNSTKKEILRNLAITEELGEYIGKGKGVIHYLLQTHQATVSFPFSLCNLFLKQMGEKPMTEDEMKDASKVKGRLEKGLEMILRGASEDVTYDVDNQVVKLTIIPTPHSSLLVEFPMADGSTGTMGLEMGRTDVTYVNGKFMVNTREQVVTAGVWQGMDIGRYRGKEIPNTIEGFAKLPNVARTKDNLGKIVPKTPLAAIKDEGYIPSKGLPNMLDKENPGYDESLFTSAGQPVAMISAEVPRADSVARMILFLTGKMPYDALRCGGYYAHDADIGHVRACELAGIAGSDLGGILVEVLLSNFQKREVYQFTQSDRESIYESILYTELFEKDSASKPVEYSKKTSQLFIKAATSSYTYLQLLYRAHEVITKRFNEEEDLKSPNPETVELSKELDKLAKNQFRRYQHIWCIYAYLVLSCTRKYGIEFILDPAVENKPRTSRVLEVALSLTNERISYLMGEGSGIPPKQPRTFSDLPNTMEKAYNLTADELSYMTAQETVNQLNTLKSEVAKAV